MKIDLFKKPQLILTIILLWLPKIINLMDEKLLNLQITLLFPVISTLLAIALNIFENTERIKKKIDIEKIEWIIFTFIAGIYFSLLIKFTSLNPNEPNIGLYLYFLPIVIILIYILYFSKESSIKSYESKAMSVDVYKMFNKDGVKAIDLLMEKIYKYNGLVAIGNLMNLSKRKGSKWLKQYLEFKTSSSNHTPKILYLVVPNYTLQYLRKIKANLNDNNLLKQIRIITLNPFVLLQGILIVGDFYENEKGIEVKGYLKYKTNITEEEGTIESGIYVDLSDNSDEHMPKELKESLKFIYDSLLKQKYNHPDDYLITQHFKDGEDKKYNYELIMTKSPMCFYCELKAEKCKNCPIYKLEATPDNVKQYFKSQGQPYEKGKPYENAEYKPFRSNI